jgi:hypothetical protein
MKVAMINFSGNVGKSTLAQHMILPRIKDAVFIPVESINADDSGVESIRGKEFGDLTDFLQIQDAAVVDVGASNVEDFVRLMKQYRGSHQDFDYYVIPTVKEKKQQKDTVATIEALSAIGVSASKIRLIFNKIEVDEKVESSFASIFAYHEAAKKFWLHPAAAIQDNEVFDRLKPLKMDVSSMVSDKTDYRAKISEAKDPNEKQSMVRMLSAQRLAQSANENFDAVFKLVFKK